MKKSNLAMDSIGETFIQNSGHTAKVINAYKSDKQTTYRVDIEFEDGTIVKNKSYSELVRGRVGKPKDYSDLIGQNKINNSGDRITIIKAQNKNKLTIQFDDGAIRENVYYSSFLKGEVKHPNYMQRRHIGETNTATNGMSMEIIGINDFKDITIRFEDGTVVEHKNYSEFKSGKIGHPDTCFGKIDRTGETVVAKNGLEATIIRYSSVLDFDVQFEDNVVVHCSNYYNFKDGIIKHPNIKGRQYTNRLGEEGVNKYGKKMTIVRFGNASDLDVQFEDGTIIKNRTYYQFKNGLIVLEKACKLDNFIDRIGEQSVSRSGYKMTIIGYRNYNDIDIQFEDGEIVKHKNYKWFKQGSIAHPKDVVKSARNARVQVNKRVGEQVINNGILMTIKEYRTSRDIDVELEDGTILEHQVYKRFKEGKIGKRLCPDKIRLGEISKADNGMQIKIVSYRDYKDIDVEFEDGAIRERVAYSNFIRGHIAHPSIKSDIDTRNGRTIQLNIGISATIINYKGARNMQIMLEDGTILDRDFDEFTTKIRHPKYKLCKHVTTFNNEKWFLCTCKKCKGQHMLKLSDMKDFECTQL